MLLGNVRSLLCFKTVLGYKSGLKSICLHRKIFRKFSDVSAQNHLVTPVENKLAVVSNHLDVLPKENEFWYKILSSDGRYRNQLAFLDYVRDVDQSVDMNEILNSDLSNTAGYPLLKYLKTVLQSCEQNPELIDKPKVTELVTRLMSQVKDLNDEQLFNLLKILTLWPKKSEDQRFFDLCKAVDLEALERSRVWGYNTLLLVMDHFYRLRVMRYSEFMWQNMKRLWRNPGKLSPQQVVHAMFLVNAHRKWNPAVNVMDVETVLWHYIYDVSVEEAGILALAFFKTRTPAHNLNLINILFDKLEQRLCSSPVHPIMLASYLKFFRLTTPFNLRQRLRGLYDKLINHIDHVSVPCCTHIALLGSRVILFHPEAIQKVCEKFCREISSARLKDLERFALALELYNFTPKTEKNIFEIIMEELHKRDDEIEQYPKIFLYTLNYLSLKGYYDYELVHKGLSIDFLRKAFKTLNAHAIPQSVFQLSAAVTLECPDYKGSRLGDSLVTQLSELHSRKLPNERVHLFNSDRIMLHAISTVRKVLGGPQFAHLTYVNPYLPHPAIIFCLRDQKAVEIPEWILSRNYMTIRQPPDIGTWYVVNRFGVGVTIVDTLDPVGMLAAKIRHQKILGYKPLALNEFHWTNLDTDKEQYVKKLIEDASGEPLL